MMMMMMISDASLEQTRGFTLMNLEKMTTLTLQQPDWIGGKCECVVPKKFLIDLCTDLATQNEDLF